MYSEPDIKPPSRRGDPVGLLLHAQLDPPVFRRARLLQDSVGYHIERTGLDAIEIGIDKRRFRVDAINDPNQLGKGLLAFNRAFGRSVPWPHCAGVVGQQVAWLNSEVPLGGYVLAFPVARPAAVHAGARLSYRFIDREVQAAMAGGAGMNAVRSKLRQVEHAQGGNLHWEPHFGAACRKSTFFACRQ